MPPGAWSGALSGLLRGDLWEGEEISRLERWYADSIGTADAVAVPSARAGLLFILESLDLPAGSEVICSAWGYPVVPHLARQRGYELRFVDCETKTLGMDPEALRRSIGEKTGAVIVTHLYGVPAQVDAIAEIAKEHSAFLIEDCAHCFAASVGGRKAGSFGDFGYFSFETSKMVNTMGGGILTVRDPERAAAVRERARKEPRKSFSWLVKRLARTTFEATVTHPLVFATAVYPALRLLSRKESDDSRFASGYHADEISMVGRLGRFTNYQARLGLRQAESLDPSVERRIRNAERLIDRLRGEVTFQEPADSNTRGDFLLVAALFENMPEMARDLLRRGVDSKHRYMRNCAALFEAEGEFPNAERAERELLHLPAYPQLSDRQIDVVAQKVRETLRAQPQAEPQPTP